MRLISEEESNSIRDSINFYQFYDLKSDLEYRNFFVSCFDHWLTEQEIENMIISYNNINIDQTNLSNNYFLLEKRLLNFYKNIYKSYDIYFIFCDNDINHLMKFSSIEEYYEFALYGIREKLCIKILILDLRTFIISGNDLTHKFYIHSDSIGHLKTLETIVTENDLFILEANNKT